VPHAVVTGPAVARRGSGERDTKNPLYKNPQADGDCDL